MAPPFSLAFPLPPPTSTLLSLHMSDLAFQQRVNGVQLGGKHILLVRVSLATAGDGEKAKARCQQKYTTGYFAMMGNRMKGGGGCLRARR